MVKKFIEALENYVNTHNYLLSVNSLNLLKRTVEELEDTRVNMYHYELISDNINNELKKVITHYRNELLFANEDTTIRLYR